MTKTDTRQTDQSKKSEEETLVLRQQLDETQKQIEKLEVQLDESTSRWKRALADYQNLEKRTEEQKRDFVQYAIKGFLEKLLGVVDDLEMAQTHLNDKGLELALKKLQSVLQEEGLERIDTKDKEYDIHTMEAINMIEGEKDNRVAAQHRAGYTMHGSVLRPAQVTVSKKKE